MIDITAKRGEFLVFVLCRTLNTAPFVRLELVYECVYITHLHWDLRDTEFNILTKYPLKRSFHFILTINIISDEEPAFLCCGVLYPGKDCCLHTFTPSNFCNCWRMCGCVGVCRW